ncbi:MAG: DUF2804 family protein [Treponema sp.]|nr:DUF2804 family protein [Treponema sp.]
MNGEAAFGTFLRVPTKIDIKGMEAPFAEFPFSSIVSNTRIKARIAYIFSIGDYIGMIEFFDNKLFGLAEVVFWYRSTGKKFAYHTFMLPHRRFIPLRTDEAVCVSHKKSRFIRLLWSRKKDRISLSFNVSGDKKRPSARAQFTAHFEDRLFQEMLAVMPAPTARRCSASWLSTMQMSGTLEILGSKKNDAVPMQPAGGIAFMVMNRAYHKYHSKSEMMCGLGDYEGRKLLFRFVATSFDSADADDNNENMIVFDGRITPMPAVTITHSFGIDKTWVVQDTESMIDLTFTPISRNRRMLNIFIMRTDYSNIYGTFDGMLLTGTGEKLLLKNFPGIVKKNLLRI